MPEIDIRIYILVIFLEIHRVKCVVLGNQVGTSNYV